MTVEFRSIYAGEFDFPAYRNATAAAHPRTIDHHRVQADEGRNVVRPGDLGDILHHDDRAGAIDRIDGGIRIVDQLPQGVRDEALDATGAVVGGQNLTVADGGELVAEDQQLFRAGADDRNDLVAKFFQGNGLRINDRGADAAADDDDRAKFGQVTGLAKWACHILKIITGLHLTHIKSGLTNGLHDQGDIAFFRALRGNGKRYAFAVGMWPDDDKLAALVSLGDPRGVDFISMQVWPNQLFLDDFKQALILSPCLEKL